MYKPSRDERGNWLSLFSDVQSVAHNAIKEAIQLHPDIHPYDLAACITSEVGYQAVCAHNRNQRSAEPTSEDTE